MPLLLFFLIALKGFSPQKAGPNSQKYKLSLRSVIVYVFWGAEFKK